MQKFQTLKGQKEQRRVTSSPSTRIIRRRSRFRPLSVQMGPVPLCITSVVLMGMMAVLYLSQLGQAFAANQHLQDLRSQQSVLARQNQDLQDILAQEQSPGFIEAQAVKLGLIPADPQQRWIVPVHNLQPLPGK
ncbi:hypothetical protein [Tengunoibacter tsumagoiensis]|uniref:Cell division protein FtsL n=1 Tax=Tengunoibacter tsumagoiensis TaxID=2014871 RepID=A0A402A5I7_9CHLR|nr:hypothetical protein [Tengunoibacter tsumagoiensis]GCE14407.1 hypothetical protein KTT_42660 [Tengunoibacter tsumagoiensis]